MVEVFIYYMAGGLIKEYSIDVQPADKPGTSSVSRDLVEKLGLKIDGNNQVVVEWRRASGNVDRETCDIEDEPGERFILGEEASQCLVAATGDDDSFPVTPGPQSASAPR